VAAARAELRRFGERLRRRRIGRPSWMTAYHGRRTDLGWRVIRTTLAAVVAYEVARVLLDGPPPLLAPLTALLVAQVTVVETVRSGIQRVASVLAGVLVAVLLSQVLGLTWWGLGLVILASLLIGLILDLGDHQLEVPISAMLVLGVVGQTEEVAAFSRVVETLIGGAVGVAASVALGPPVYVRPAAEAIGELAEDEAGLLKAMGEELTDDWTTERARIWLERSGELDQALAEAATAMDRGEASLVMNPRARHLVEGTLSLRAALAVLEHCAVQLRGIVRDLADFAAVMEERDEAEPEILVALGRLLVELGEGVTAFGSLVAPDVVSQPGEAIPLRIALEIAQAHRDMLAEIMLVDFEADPALWQIQGSLLANVDRLLREIDIEQGPEARRVRHI
jgi:uncharacterized membrane protein YccC